MSEITNFYENQLRKYTALAEEYTQKNRRLSLFRVLWFLLWVLAIFISTSFDLAIVFATIIIGLATFVILVTWHNRILKLKKAYELYRDINDYELKALNNDYSNFEDGEEYIDEKHYFSYDLDVFGPFSLFQYLNRTYSPQGKTDLANRLGEGFIEKPKILAQQVAIGELAKRHEWMQEFRVLGAQTTASQKKKASPISSLSEWAVRKGIFSHWAFKIVVPFISLLSFFMLYLLINGQLGFNTFMLYMVVPLGFSGYFAKRINANHIELGKQSSALQQWKSVFESFEKQLFDSDTLKELQENLKLENESASIAIKKLSKLSQAFDTRLNLFGWFILNFFSVWDVLQSIRLENWRQKYGTSVGKWFAVLAEMETLVSLGTFNYNHPESIFPEIIEEGFVFEAEEAAHPLLPKDTGVANDISFPGLGQFNIVTGANMAGKSTYLRTVGAQLILSMAGSAVCAKRLRITPIQMFTSIRTKDSLARNESYFYAELLRLQGIIEELKSGMPLFIILDEILKGTNSKDKEMGSKALVAQLIGLKAVGLIATHDLQLGTLIDSFPDSVQNKCFEVDLVDGKLHFDYKLRDGISQNLNATFLMKQMGITGI
ncbi:hypothetical protein [Lentimicrobium sp. S6]|uniref:MutS-related protein n=1 Tax=Lentimicrobium sp. S6 TaxID=2735872 RepID=UPI0015551C66|nr:hypothetical protein [Lentimicrobium sp. S6]NPD44758.1 hypothetical protein [Lentimicrobium sp. S6]